MGTILTSSECCMLLDSHKARQARLCLTNQPSLTFLALARNDRLMLDLYGSVDSVGIDDDGHSVEPHDFPDPWVRKRHGLVSQPPFLPPLAPLRRV